MRWLPRPTYSSIVATLALFIALGGAAYAATSLPRESIGSAQIKEGAVTPSKLSASVESSLEGPRGAEGARGARGATGSKGATGETGATGANGATGATGQAGATGSNGTPGAAGSNGEVGPRGE